MTRLLVALTLALVPTAAFAGACDAHVKKASTVKGEELVKAYKDLLACSKNEAEVAYDAFMKASGDVGTLVDLSLAAIDAKVYSPVWAMQEKIPDYSARDEIAKGVGANCAAHPEVVTFLQGAYFGLRDIQFAQWDDALVTCESPALVTWMQGVVAKPPASAYDEKYAAIVTAYVRRERQKSLDTLSKAAAEAAKNNGPFNLLIEKMDAAIESPEIGEEPTEADRKLLADALVALAKNVNREQAAMVADRLYNAGAESAAASLLPQVYPDRVQSDGTLLYGVAAVEQCDKEATIHWMTVSDPAKRWSILRDAEAAARAAKPRHKCAVKEPWPVVATPEPVAGNADVQKWVDGLVAEWSAKGLDVKAKEEKSVALK